MNDAVKKTVQATLGLVIAFGAAAAWRFWNIDGMLAILVVFGGLWNARADAFGFEFHS